MGGVGGGERVYDMCRKALQVCLIILNVVSLLTQATPEWLSSL